MDHLKIYKERFEHMNNYVKILEVELNKSIERYEKAKLIDDSRKEDRLKMYKGEIIRKEYAVGQVLDEIEFLRPATEEDILYRDRQYKEFSKKIEETVPEDFPLCFHGTPIYKAKRIIGDGGISSSVDRIGSSTSYDQENMVSVTDRKSISTTITGYAGLCDNFYVPAGCIFVIVPEGEEVQTASKSMVIGNVDFKNNPNRLHAIITSLEGVDIVKKWAEEANIDISKIHDYDGFIETFHKNKIK